MAGLRTRGAAGTNAVPALAALGAIVAVLMVGGQAPAVRAAVIPPPVTSWTCPIAPAAPPRPATELRIVLGRLLGEHAYLLMEAMRSAASSHADLGALNERLDANTTALSEAIRTTYGGDAADQFRELWERHIDAALEYSTAVATGDDATRSSANAALQSFGREFGAFLRGANPALDASEEAHAVRLHLDHLTAFADGDYATGYEAAREAYAHMFKLGDRLARAIADEDLERYPDARVAFSPASELTLLLDRLLGEHLILAAEAMRASLDEAPNLAAARQALDGNSADLAAAIGRVYDDAAGAAFAEVWTAHLTAYLDYIDALRADDRERTRSARQSLEAYGNVLGSFLAEANPHLTADSVADLIGHHTTSLLAMVDEYRAGEFDAAYATVADAYEHMYVVGGALATAIAAQFPTRFDDMEDVPRTNSAPAPTGRTVEHHWLMLAAAVVGAAVGWRGSARPRLQRAGLSRSAE